jgi:cell division protein FtsW
VIAASIVIATSNRARRVLAFLDPWSPEFARTEGFQLTNSLIAFGRGEFFGVGLGNSVEKLNHLSEAHTDFILAIIAEELGFLGVLIVVACFAWIVFKAFALGRRAQEQKKLFESLVAQGIGLWIGLQAGIHLCVNAGALPTKGLTLPFISYGGSAMLMSMVAVAVLLRIDYELRMDSRGQLL